MKIWTALVRVFHFLFGWLLPSARKEDKEAKELIEKTARSIDGFEEIHAMPWVMFQRWQSVCFMHYPIDMHKLSPHVPDGLSIDTYNGQAWISLLPMHMVNLHLHDTPAVPGTSDFPEINLRTYVKVNDRPGVYFFSIDAESYLGSWVAKFLFHLPYVDAKMKIRKDGGRVSMQSDRPKSKKFKAARFSGWFEPYGPLKKAEEGSLEFFLAERYTAFSADVEGRLYRGDLVHQPWEIRDAKFHIEENTILEAAGLDVGGAVPQVHFSPGTDSFIWPMLPLE